MILDDQLKFSEAQAVTAAATSTDYIDLLAARDIGALMLCIEVWATTAFVGSGGTLKVEAQFSAATTFATTDDVEVGNLAVGDDAPLRYRLAPGQGDKRYLRLKYTPTSLTTGKVDAYLTDGLDTAGRIYPQAASTKVAS